MPNELRCIKFQIYAHVDGVTYSIGDRGQLYTGDPPIVNQHFWDDSMILILQQYFVNLLKDLPQITTAMTHIEFEPRLDHGVPADQTWDVSDRGDALDWFDTHLFTLDPDTWNRRQARIDANVDRYYRAAADSITSSHSSHPESPADATNRGQS